MFKILIYTFEEFGQIYKSLYFTFPKQIPSVGNGKREREFIRQLPGIKCSGLLFILNEIFLW